MDPVQVQPQSGKQPQSVPYGQACSNCSHAKCRCIPQINGICERCQRLRKECIPAPNVRKRKPKTPTSTSKRARIEEKLDDLVSLLQSQNAAKALTDLGGSGRTNVSSPASQPWASESLQGDGELGCPASGFPAAILPSGTIPRPEVQSLRGPALPPLANASYETPESLTDATDVGGASYAEAEAILHEFRTKRLRHFPILYIPPEMNAQALQRDRPFLWLCIRARIEYLHMCLQVTKAYLERFHKLDAAAIAVCCSSVMFHFACAMKVLYRLLLLEDPGWDRVEARKEVDIVHHLEQVVDKFERAHMAAGIDNSDSEGRHLQARRGRAAADESMEENWLSEMFLTWEGS
ncbi:uncharacterized protein PG998_007023 [Apiospora kogelbergensis]|uniref:uncharacterized protein n=1 Tax=Apiospora kogelbergensis TaxID=1337665 RepID=UPI00313234C9